MNRLNTMRKWKKLKKVGSITKNMMYAFHDAYSSDAATTVDWLWGKLGIVWERLAKGDSLPFEPAGKALDKNNFMEWIGTEFPNIKWE